VFLSRREENRRLARADVELLLCTDVHEFDFTLLRSHQVFPGLMSRSLLLSGAALSALGSTARQAREGRVLEGQGGVGYASTGATVLPLPRHQATLRGLMAAMSLLIPCRTVSMSYWD
jgi:hypothetical protein